MQKGTKKILLVASLVAGSLFLMRKVKKSVDFVKQLSITPRLDSNKKISFKSSYLNIPLAIDFANRSDMELKVAIPNIIIFYDNKQVGSLAPNSQTVTIKKYTTSALTGLTLQIPYLQLLSVAGTAIATWITDGNYNRILENLSLKISLLVENKYNITVPVRFNQTADVDGGVGLVPYSERKISPLSDYAAYIPPKSELKHTDPVLIPNGTVEDTVDLMHQIVRETANDTKQLAKHLQKDTLKNTLQSIFDFVYTHIAYERDSIFQEQVRRPLRTLYDQKGDCDCYATLIGSMLYNLGVPFKFRIAEYAHKGYYQHVYVIVPYSGGYYTVDPVLDHFNEEKPTTKHKDF